MSEEFDPYRKWLGIPPKEQPPHHYRLLGIALFEDDPDVIENAADRQMSHVRTYQSGKHGKASQKILNELSAAKLCLLTGEKKTDYDRDLKQLLRAKKQATQAGPVVSATNAAPKIPAAVPAATAVPVAQTPTASDPMAPMQAAPTAAATPTAAYAQPAAHADPVVAVRSGGSSTAATYRRRRKQSLMPIIISVVAVVILAVVGLIVVPKLMEKPEPEEGTTTKQPPTTPRQTPPKKTNPSKKRTPRKDGKQLTSDPGKTTPPPVDPDNPFENLTPDGRPPITPQPDMEAFRKAIEDARAALAKRDPDLAKFQLNIAGQVKSDDEQESQIADLQSVVALVAAFEDDAESGLQAFRRNESFEFGAQEFRYESYELKTLVYQVDGTEFSSRLKELPAIHLAAIAMQARDADPGVKELNAAAFLAFDGGVTAGTQREQAIELYRVANDAGQSNTVLAAELGLPPDMTSSPPPTIPTVPSTPDPDTSSPFEPVAPTKATIPNAAAIRGARLQIRQIYEDEFDAARRGNDGRLSLAETLAQAAKDEADAALKFTLLDESRELYFGLGNPTAMLDVLKRVSEHFEYDFLVESQIALSKISTRPGVDPDVVFQSASDLFSQAIDAQRYAVAEKLGDVAERAARRAKNFDAVREVTEKVRGISTLAKEQRAADDARNALEADPDDAESNETLGRFLCFRRGKWEEGLPFLAKGPEGDEAETALADLNMPTDAEQMADVGDKWYAIAQAAEAEYGTTVLERAKHWYAQAVNDLTGLRRSAVEKRLRDINAALLGS